MIRIIDKVGLCWRLAEEIFGGGQIVHRWGASNKYIIRLHWKKWTRKIAVLHYTWEAKMPGGTKSRKKCRRGLHLIWTYSKKMVDLRMSCSSKNQKISVFLTLRLHFRLKNSSISHTKQGAKFGNFGKFGKNRRFCKKSRKNIVFYIN